MPPRKPVLTLDEQLCFSLYGAAMAVNRAYKPLLDDLGITYPQYLVLSVLWESDEQTVGSIAGRLSLDSSTVTPLLKRLEAAGLVTRRRDLADERQLAVGLTERGRRLHERSACLGEALVAASAMSLERLRALTSEVQALRDAVASSVDRTAEAGRPASDANSSAG